MLSRSSLQSLVVALAAVATTASASVLVRDWRTAPKVVTDRRLANHPALVERGFIRGPDSAAHTLVVFTDFTCSYCRYYRWVVDTLLMQHDDLRVVERHLPQIGFHLAWEAAAAAECAGEVGRYAQMRALLYRSALSSADWGRLAAAAGVQDTATFKRCMLSQAVVDRIARDTAAGRPIAAGTPTVILDGLRFGTPPTVATVAARMAAR